MAEVLIIDDNSFDVKLLIDLLQRGHFTVLTDGEVALRYVESTDCIPTLILLDLNMPKITGDLILKAIRNRKEFDATPVVIFTGTQSIREREACLKLGATEFITKPLNLAEAMEVVNQIKRLVNYGD